MGLADFDIDREEIKFKTRSADYSFTVRGLCLEDITQLIKSRLQDIEEAIKLYTELKADVYTGADMGRFVLALATQAPGLIAEIISVAADERHLVANYAKLPMGVMAQAFEKVIALTMSDIGGLKNFQATLASVLAALLPADVLVSLEKALKSSAPIGRYVRTSRSFSRKDIH